MRFVLTLGLLIVLCESASATTVHRMRHHWIVRHGNGEILFGHSARAYVPAGRPMQYDDVPSHNDPSKFGGQSLGMDP